MSWLLAVFVPGLLMLAPIGLGRVESRLEAGAEDGNPIDGLLASPAPAPAPARRPPSVVAPGDTIHPSFTGLAALCDEPGLPTRLFRYESANPQFSQICHTNRV